MTNIITNFSKKIASFVLELYNTIRDMPKLYRESLVELKLFIRNQIFKLQNITETNIELGKYHLNNGDIGDAILRFKIAKLLFDKENPVINYWLGWCYFLKADYNLTLKFLSDIKSLEANNLKNFIKDADNIKEVPNDIWHMIKSSTLSGLGSKYYVSNLYNKPIDMPTEFMEFALAHIEEIPNNTKILDFGASKGFVGALLDYKTDAKYSIAGMDDLEIFVSYIKEIRGERGVVYDEMLYRNLHDPKAAVKGQKYDIIFSFDSLAFVRDFSKYFTSFYESLNREGYFVILLPKGTTSGWNPKNMSYKYKQSDIESQLNLAKFNIMAIKEWSLGKEKTYISFICKK
ncbi:MAG UNVERIFIED_CONTAM: class I SAM-dependent methyltransferase [Rickettsiaceae bacterium]|jgi:SAM-dependent methyltransferase